MSRRSLSIAVALPLLLVASVGFSSAEEVRATGVGRDLRLTTDTPMMQPVTVPARIARVAMAPGGNEGWAIGFSHARERGFDQIQPLGQVVFLRFTRATGWQVAGAPVDDSGKPFNPQLTSLAIAPSGEGWATGAQGILIHHRPGGPWQLDPAASAISRGTLTWIALAQNRSGVYGYAVGESLTFLRLSAGRWQNDVANVTAPSAGPVPDLASVAVVSRDDAWAVSGSTSDQLLLFHRTGGAWQRALTGEAIFDSPPAPAGSGSDGTVNRYAHGNAVVVSGGDVWVSGSMLPVDATKPTGGGDHSRPFALHGAGATFTSFCPVLYQFSSAGVAHTIHPCDREFPQSSGELPALSTTKGEVFAGGAGLFHYAHGVWTRAPDTAGYVISASFSSPADGWVATQGNVFGASQAATSSALIVGHWTEHPDAPLVTRWAYPDARPLEALALDPSGSGRAMAVGQEGAIAWIDPQIGSDTMPSPVGAALHGIAWPARDSAWAVGAGGAVVRFDGERWIVDEAASSLTHSSLIAVAFDPAGRGYAVGANGTILRFNGTNWSLDPSSGEVAKRLVAIASNGGTFVAVGDKGTILENTTGRWRARTELAHALISGQEGEAPNLLSVAGDGAGFLIGGGRSVLIERTASGELRLGARAPTEGSIAALSSNGTDVIASVSNETARLNRDRVGLASGWPVLGDDRGWHDIGFEHAMGISPDNDAPAPRDAVLAIAIEPGARMGWAVGGFAPNVLDDDGHVRAFGSASVWRIGLDGPSHAPSEVRAEIPRARGLTFAFLGDTSCSTGNCSTGVGSGTRADEIALAALTQINGAARNGDVRFLAFGGDLRRNGSPDELDQLRALLNDMPVPVFAVLGDKDQFAGPAQSGAVLSTNGYYLDTFRRAPQPFGQGARIAGFVPVAIGAAPDATKGARTHYAFDLQVAGKKLARFVFLDTSRVPLATNAAGQNPSEDQSTWLQDVATDARLSSLPWIAFMHQPLLLPISTAADASVLTPIFTAGGASAALASHLGTNEVVATPSAGVPGAFPFGVFGSGGSPLGNADDPVRGSYFAWQLVTIDTDPGARSALGQSPVIMRSEPVLSSIALHADSWSARAGAATRVTASGRAPDGGAGSMLGTDPDPNDGRATYVPFPYPRVCSALEDPTKVACRPSGVAVPDHRFVSEDESIATFVREDSAHPGRPYRTSEGTLVRDDQSAFLCTFRPGSVIVGIDAGVVGARVPLTVRGGAGPCVPGIFADPATQAALPAQAAIARVVPHQQDTLLRPHTPQQQAVGAVAPPVVNVAPAPPGGGAAKKEEQEAASERSEMTALHRRGVDHNEPLVVLLMLIALAIGGALVARKKPQPQRSWGDR